MTGLGMRGFVQSEHGHHASLAFVVVIVVTVVGIVVVSVVAAVVAAVVVDSVGHGCREPLFRSWFFLPWTTAQPHGRPAKDHKGDHQGLKEPQEFQAALVEDGCHGSLVR